jgi:hypothetical protein
MSGGGILAWIGHGPRRPGRKGAWRVICDRADLLTRHKALHLDVHRVREVGPMAEGHPRGMVDQIARRVLFEPVAGERQVQEASVDGSAV